MKQLLWFKDNQFWLLPGAHLTPVVYPSANQDTDRAWREYERKAGEFNAALKMAKENKILVPAEKAKSLLFPKANQDELSKCGVPDDYSEVVEWEQ